MTQQTPMPRQAPEKRIHNFKEVALGYTEEMAEQEAGRCLGCKNPSCVKGCPVGVDIPGFIRKIKEKSYVEASFIIKKTNSLPAVCGRVCPQENQCQKHCVLGAKGAAVAIGRLERFVADWESENACSVLHKPKHHSLGKYHVAVVGSGPSGLTVAGTLAPLGYKVTVFEALHKTGGVLRYGIPEFRLPRDVMDREIDYIKALGVKIIKDAVIGKSAGVMSLFDEGFDAVYLGTGSGTPKLLGIKGENLSGVFSGNEWLTRINLMRAFRDDYLTPFPSARRVVIIGAGNTAMDCARCALRTGAEKVTVVYRRSREDMPARKEEIENAEEEGVKFVFLRNPAEFLGEDALEGVRCAVMEPGEPDSSGRPRPVPVEGAFETIEADCAVVALGQNPNPLIRTTTRGLKMTRWGGIVTDPETCMTNIPGIFAGGDVVTGEATVISAMGAGRRAAKGIENYIRETYKQDL